MSEREHRYVHYFADGIDSNTVNELIDVLHQHEKVDLFFATPGGDISAMKVLIHYMESHPDLMLYLTVQICSAGTLLITDYSGPIVLHEELDYFMFHVPDIDMFTTRSNGFDKKQLERIIKTNAYHESMKLTLLGFPDKEVKKFLKGQDIYLYKIDFGRLTNKRKNITI